MFSLKTSFSWTGTMLPIGSTGLKRACRYARPPWPLHRDAADQRLGRASRRAYTGAAVRRRPRRWPRARRAWFGCSRCLARTLVGLSASTIGRLKDAWSDEHARWRSAISRPSAMSISRSMAFTCRPGSKTSCSACWSSSALHPRVRRSCRPHRRRARERAILARITPRPQAAWACRGSRARGRRWRARLLTSGRRDVASDARPALLGNKLPKSQQSKAKRALQEIWMVETKKDALASFDAFVEHLER
jgi:hypothetical protein